MDFKAVIGIYGVSGSGKSRLLSALQSSRPEWRCLEGSQVIDMIMQEQGESLSDFRTKGEFEKTEIRNRAIQKIQSFSGVIVVAGHCSFPETCSTDGDFTFENLFTKGDGETFDVILYLDKNAEIVHNQREQDTETSKRSRPRLSVDIIQEWVEHEEQVLQKVCDKHDISFSLISDEDLVEGHIAEHLLAPLVSKVQAKSEQNLKEAVLSVPASDVFLLIDGDRTLCPMDTGKVFIDFLPDIEGGDPLKKIFKRYDSYSFQAFLEVARFYDNVISTTDYQDLSLKIGRDEVTMYDEWIQFLTSIHPTVQPIVLTSGNREIWQAALESNNLGNVTLLAGNHIGLHSYIVDSQAKAVVAKKLRDLHGGCKIISFGDSGMSRLRRQSTIDK